MENLLVIAVSMILVVWIVFQSVSKQKAENWSLKELNSELKNLQNFTNSQEFISKDLSSAIAIDTDKNQICLITIENDTARHVIIPYKDILSSEIVEDGSSLTKTARGSQLGGALIGAVLLGGTGAIIGGLSGEKHTVDKVKNIDLLIIVNNTDEPIFKVNFLTTNVFNLNKIHNPDSYDKDSSEYKSAASKAKEWHSIMAIIIKKADEADKEIEKIGENNYSTNSNMNLSVSDEIRKLKALKDDGLITDDEFISQKYKMLNR